MKGSAKFFITHWSVKRSYETMFCINVFFDLVLVYVPKHCTHIQGLCHSERNKQASSTVDKYKEWMVGSYCWDCKCWVTSPSATLDTSKRHALFNSVHFSLLVLHYFSAEGLVRGESWYQLLWSDLLYWLRPHWNQESTAF